MSYPIYNASTGRRPLAVVTSVIALIGTAILIGLIASGQLSIDEDIDILSFADEQLEINRIKIQSAFDAYPPAGYTPRPRNTERQRAVESPHPSPSPVVSGTAVPTIAVEGTPSGSNRPDDEPAAQIASSQTVPISSATAVPDSGEHTGESVTPVPTSEQLTGASVTPETVSEQPPSESLEIASPVNEALLCSGFTIKGSASGLASGQLAMILLQSAEGGRIYPQGPLVPNEEGNWQINVVGLSLGQRFSLTPVLPHGESLAQLNEYLQTGLSTGVWAGLDAIHGDANVFDTIYIQVDANPCPGFEDPTPGDDTEYNGYKVIGS